MRRRVILCALACAALGSGCSTAHILLPRRTAPEGVEARAEALRDAAWSALATGDTVGLARVLGDGVVILAAGDTLRDAQSIASALPLFAGGATQLDPTFFREGVHWCTDAFVEYGTIGLYRDDGGRRPVRVGRVSMTWDVRDPAGVGLRSASFHPVDGGDSYRARPCATPMDSVFAQHRTTVLVHAVSSVPRDWQSGVRSGLDEAGWGAAGIRYSAPAVEVKPSLAVRVRVPGPFTLGAFGSAIGGGGFVEHPDQSTVGLDYDGLLAGVLAGAEWGFFSLGGGPTYLHVSGDWQTIAPGGEGAPIPTNTDARAWNAWAVGATGEVGVTLPLSTRFALDGRYQYRYFPAAGVPGYRASRAMDIEFTHSVLLVGIGASF